MLIACWSAKGGSGTTVVAVALALLRARSSPGVLLVDLAGDAPVVLGMPEPDGPGVCEWLSAGVDVPADALRRLELEVNHDLHLLPWGLGRATGDAAAGERLAVALAGDRHTVVDCGSADSGSAQAVAGAATLSLLVVRPCYLGLRRAAAAPLRPSGVVLVGEPGRSLGRRDVEEVLGVPVRAEVPYDPAVARAVDAGTLAQRVPKGLARALRGAA